MLRFKSPRAAIMLVFAAFGAAVGCWAGAIPHVMAQAGIGSYQLGLGLTASTIATVTAMALGGSIGKHFSNRAVLLAEIPLLALFTVTLLTATSPLVFFVSLVGFGAILGFMDLFMNAEASAIEHDVGYPIFTAFHGCVSISIAVLAIISSFVTTLLGPWVTSLFAIASLILAWVMVYGFVPPRMAEIEKSHGLSLLPSRLPLIIIGLAVGLSVAAETSALFWSAKLLNEQAPSLAAIAGLGAAFYGSCNAVVRFMGDGLRSRFGDIPVMLASLLVAMMGFTLLGISTSFTPSVIAFAGVGFGLAITCPCLFNMAAAQVPANRAAALSFISFIAGAPRVLAPWIFGWIATSHTTSFAFGLCGAVLAVAIGLIMYLKLLLTPPDKQLA
jgi:MFS family permease